ncbi:MAG: hypothetical protein AB7T63_00165 [Planctomycetota bacterium]
MGEALRHTSSIAELADSTFTLVNHAMGLRPNAIAGGMFGFANEFDAASGVHEDVGDATRVPQQPGQDHKEAYRDFLLPLVRSRSSVTETGARCCPEVEPPAISAYERKSRRAPWQTFVGWKITMAMVFKKLAPCNCPCCEYHQFVDYLVRVWSTHKKRGDVTPETSGGFREDCTPPPAPPKPPRVFCPGSSDPEHRYPAGARNPVTGEIIEERETDETECRFRYRDAPGRWVTWGASFFLRYEFIFVVFDVCNNYAIKWLLHILLQREGTVSESGLVTDAELGSLP